VETSALRHGRTVAKRQGGPALGAGRISRTTMPDLRSAFRNPITNPIFVFSTEPPRALRRGRHVPSRDLWSLWRAAFAASTHAVDETEFRKLRASAPGSRAVGIQSRLSFGRARHGRWTRLVSAFSHLCGNETAVRYNPTRAYREIIIDKESLCDVQYNRDRADKTIGARHSPLATAVSACYI